MDRSLTTSYDVKLLTENVRKRDRKSVQKIGISAAADEALQDGMQGRVGGAESSGGSLSFIRGDTTLWALEAPHGSLPHVE